MKRILFPTEFSAHAPQVFQYAVDLAKRHKASLVLFHAFKVPLNPATTENELGSLNIDLLKKFALDHTPKTHKAVPLEFIAEMVIPADGILRIVEDEAIDLIVMGTKGKTNALEAYFGSVALDVVSRTEIPVFLVPSTHRFKSIDKIAYAFDAKLDDLLYLKSIYKYIHLLKAKITAIHFIENDEDVNRIEEAIVLLKDLYKYHPKYQDITFDLTYGDFEKNIHDYIVEGNVDLLVTHSHTRNWKFRFIEPSISTKIARKIEIPLLILKDEKSKPYTNS